jgi:hypothetical protein
MTFSAVVSGHGFHGARVTRISVACVFVGGLSLQLLPSGKLSHNYGKLPFLMGKLTINGDFQ